MAAKRTVAKCILNFDVESKRLIETRWYSEKNNLTEVHLKLPFIFWKY